ncbi:MAG TPA: hypothetical protein DCM31_03115 [Deferribacteraceae bacterium]|jgi:DNA repair exonuclease SbcCD nuclease subunit|nr:hypothetical protein [Deferribacteraceae bacterium]
MYTKKNERRRHKRYSGVPLKLYLKKDGEYKQVELVDISIGGFLSNTAISFEIYDDYEAKVQFPNHGVKDVVHAHAVVWRTEANKEEISAKKRFVAFQFTKISDVDKHLINEFLNEYEENVPYK